MKKSLFILFYMVALGIMVFHGACYARVSKLDDPEIKDGVLDLREWDFSSNGQKDNRHCAGPKDGYCECLFRE
jgi:hypothetical protein